MNQLGKQYIEQVQKDWKELWAEIRKRKSDNPTIEKWYQRENNPSNERIYQRLMRLGREHKVYELQDQNEDEQIARATLKEDFIKSWKGSKDTHYWDDPYQDLCKHGLEREECTECSQYGRSDV